MAKSKRKRVPKTVLKLPDLEQSKSAVLNSLTSSSSKRSYDHAIREFELFVIDPYLSTEICDTYAGAIPRIVQFRLLSANVSPAVLALGLKYASGGNVGFRCSKQIHDRVIFVDQRVWVCGQSLKDAAKRKPTYIVEFGEALMRPVYEPLWNSAQPIL